MVILVVLVYFVFPIFIHLIFPSTSLVVAATSINKTVNVNAVSNVPYIFYQKGYVALYSEELDTGMITDGSQQILIEVDTSTIACTSSNSCYNGLGNLDNLLQPVTNGQPIFPTGALVYRIGSQKHSLEFTDWNLINSTFFVLSPPTQSGKLFFAFWDVNNVDNNGFISVNILFTSSLLLYHELVVIDFNNTYPVFNPSLLHNDSGYYLTYSTFDRSPSTTSPRLSTFTNDNFWMDTEKNIIHAHDLGVIFDTNTQFYYVYGTTALIDYYANLGINVYRSKDLVDWEFRGQAVTQEQLLTYFGGIHNSVYYYANERPKVVYNSFTKKYVMWTHVWTYDFTMGGSMVLTSDKPDSGYSVLSFDGTTFGRDGGDQSIFVDPKSVSTPKQAIRLVYNGGGPFSQFQPIYLLSLDSTYTQIDKVLSYVYRPEGVLEAPAIFYYEKLNGYFLLASLQNGWKSSQTFAWFATALTGPWLDVDLQMGTFPDPLNTFKFLPSWNAQTTFILPSTTNPDRFIWMADRWKLYECIPYSAMYPNCYNQPNYGLLTQLPNAVSIWLELIVHSQTQLEIVWSDNVYL